MWISGEEDLRSVNVILAALESQTAGIVVSL